jgi:hypothetical protein
MHFNLDKSTSWLQSSGLGPGNDPVIDDEQDNDVDMLVAPPIPNFARPTKRSTRLAARNDYSNLRGR